MNIRLERENEFFQTEKLVREAFWNKYRPGCVEHYVLHVARKNKQFVKNLNYVITEGEKLVAQITYFKAFIKTDLKKKIPILTFGPVSVLPEEQGKGYGSKLITYTMNLAKSLGYKAVAITGSPEYYHRFGFESGSKLGVYYAPCGRAEEAPFFMVKELEKDALKGVVGEYSDPEVYNVNDSDVEKFDETFPLKSKLKNDGQIF